MCDPSYERAVSDQDRSMHISLWVYVTHSLFIEWSHMTKNTAFGLEWHVHVCFLTRCLLSLNYSNVNFFIRLAQNVIQTLI
jgi:hypothetical protein